MQENLILDSLNGPYARGWDAYMHGCPFMFHETEAWQQGWKDCELECVVQYWEHQWSAAY